jgi:hypothetical protein
MFRLSLIAAVFFAISAPSPAQIVFVDPPQKPAQIKAEQSKSDWDKVECRNQDVLGSRLQRHRVCLTKWQWWSYEQETKQWIESMERLGTASH